MIEVLESDVRLTPSWLLDVVRQHGVITLDPCTVDANPTGAMRFYTPAQDGLRASWECDGRLAWCNPPWSRGQVIRWADKAIVEARLGSEIIMLTLADVRTSWFRKLADNADAYCLINRSVGFLELVDGAWKAKPGHTMGCAAWYWGWRRRRFDRVFSAIGRVIHGLGPEEVTT